MKKWEIVWPVIFLFYVTFSKKVKQFIPSQVAANFNFERM